jgi:predicted nucleotidyltransferase
MSKINSILSEMLNETKNQITESVLDPLQDEMCSELWDSNNKLLKSAKKYIIDKLDAWLKTKTDKTYKNVFILGSMTGFQYTKDSDIDVNFVIDMPEDEMKNILRKPINIELNEKPLPGTEHPVNYYVSPKFKEEWKKEGGIYDVLEDKWISTAEKEDNQMVIRNYKTSMEIARFFTSGLDIVMAEFYSDKAAYASYLEYGKKISEKEQEDYQKLLSLKLQEILADIDSIYIAKHLLKSLRAESLEKDSTLEISSQIIVKDNLNNSINNLIYKYIEKMGYFKRIQDILDEKAKWKEMVDAT